MECKNIITIGREYGAGGRSVAKHLSEILNIPYYDKDIIKIAAEESGFTEDMLRDTEDTSAARNIFNWFMPSGTSSAYDQAILAQVHTIRSIARKGPCIIVGRGADFVLQDFPNVVNVFICADPEDKIRYSMEANNETHEQAARRVKHVDAARESYYHYITRGKWGELRNYDMTLNSSTIGKAACAEIIAQFALKKK